MATFTYDHIHLRSPNPEKTAQWYERMFGAEVLRTMQQGKPRIDLKLGGANIFIAETTPEVNPAPTTPYQGLDHFGLSVSNIDAVAADLKGVGVRERHLRHRPRGVVVAQQEPPGLLVPDANHVPAEQRRRAGVVGVVV